MAEGKPLLPTRFPHPPLTEYDLLDSGGGEKLERFGPIRLVRPDPQALWRPKLPREAWKKADLRFVRESDRGGRWEARKGAPAGARGREPAWPIEVAGARLLIRPTPFKHVGLFPEQATNWAWTRECRERFEGEPRLLNLFGYTGAASVLAARDGWHVTHLDASKSAVAWARENAELSGVDRKSIRFLVEDAVRFAAREERRGSRYEAILVDPPHYGRGPKGEKWQFEEGIAPLLETCGKLLAERSLLILSTYAIGYSPLAFLNLLEELGGDRLESGELALPEEGSGASDETRRYLPCGFCARWSRGV